MNTAGMRTGRVFMSANFRTVQLAFQISGAFKNTAGLNMDILPPKVVTSHYNVNVMLKYGPHSSGCRKKSIVSILLHLIPTVFVTFFL